MTNDEQREAIAPCPFCGIEPEAEQRDGYAAVWCAVERCGLEPCANAPTLPEAIAKWNTRALPVGGGVEEALREAARDAIEDLQFAADAAEARNSYDIAASWRKSASALEAALSPRSADGDLEARGKDGAAAPPQAPVAGSEDSASEVAG